MKILRIFPIILFAFLFVGGFWAVIQVYGAPTTGILVDTLADEIADDGYCSLREAISAANDNSSINECPAGESGAPDTITFSKGGTISLTEVLTVSAGGPLVIDGGGVITLSGQNSVRVLIVWTEAQVTLENITVADGFVSEEGGGIINGGTLTRRRTDVDRRVLRAHKLHLKLLLWSAAVGPAKQIDRITRPDRMLAKQSGADVPGGFFRALPLWCPLRADVPVRSKNRCRQ